MYTTFIFVSTYVNTCGSFLSDVSILDVQQNSILLNLHEPLRVLQMFYHSCFVFCFS